MERMGRVRQRQMLELLESRQLMSAGGGVDVALVDNTLPQYRQLMPAIHGKVIEFDGKNDSAAKVLGKLATWASATGTKIHSISILSHGAEGKFRLGNEWISTEGEHEKAWKRLRGVLDAKAQIYVFGCSVAGKNGNGQMLLDHLATLSGAKVFGSTDVTGKGGNWLLEASDGADPKTAVAGPVDGLKANSIWAYKLAPGITVTPTSGLVTTEAGGQATFDVVLDAQPVGDVVIPITSSDTAEGTVSVTSLTFTPADWDTAQTVTVTGANDAVDDGDKAFTIVTGLASSTDPAYDTMDAADVSVTNTDNDTAGFTVTPTSGLVTSEAGAQATFDVVLTSQPTSSVTIAISSSNTAEGTVSTSLLTFTTANWNIAKTVTVTGVNDFVDDENLGYTVVTGAASSLDLNYNTMDPADAAVTNTDDDTAGISVTPTSGLTTTEAGGQATFDVVLLSQPTASVTISIASTNTAEGTVSTSSLTFTTGNWNVPKTVTITGINDFVDDGTIAYTITTGVAVSADPKYNGMNPADVAVSNTDNDTAGINVSPTSGLVTTEAGGQATFDVVLTSQPTDDVTIPISSSNTAEGTVSTSSLTFTPGNWNVPQTVTVTGVDDFVDDGNKAYTIVTGAATSTDGLYNGMDAANVAASNTDNDTAGISVSPTSGLVTTEAGGQAVFDMVLLSQPTASVTISIASSNTAEGTVSTSSLTFTAGNWNVAQQVTVTGVNDPVDDGNIGYTITTGVAVSADANYSGINPADVSVSNTDNDTAGITVTPTSGLTTTEAGGQASFDVVLDSQPTANVTVSITSTNTAEGTVSTSLLTFTAANWNVPHTVTVTGVNDFVADGNIGYTITTGAATSTDPNYNAINPADVSVTNNDNDTAGISVTPTSGLVTTEAGGQASFGVVLTSQPLSNVTVAITSTNTAEGTVSTSLLTFTSANWNVPHTVTVTGVNDFVDDGDIAYSITTGTSSSVDPNYNAINPADVTVTNTDNDTAGITVSPTSGLTTTEAGAQASFTVVLTSQPTADVTIPISSSNTAEGTVSVASLTFTALNWNIAQTVTVTGQDDFVSDGNIAYSIVTGAAVSGDGTYSGMDPSNVSVTNTDNDVAGITVTPTSGLVTTEAGAQASFNVVLTSQPTADVTIAISSSNTAEGTVSTSLLTFTAGNWNIAQTVTVTGQDDFVDDGNISYSIVTAAATSADANYSGRNAADVTVSNTDDDTAGITVSPTSGLTTSEAGSEVTFDVVLNSQPTANVTIGISSNDTTEGMVSTSSLTFTAANWNVPQTVTISSLDDLIVDGDITYKAITAAAVSSDPLYNGMNPSDVTVVNRDNDPNGVKIGSEFRVNTTTANAQQFSTDQTQSIAMDANGNYVVTWESSGQDGSGYGIYARLYDYAGNPLSGEIPVNTTTSGDQKYRAVAMDPNGNFVVVWSSNGQDGSGWGIYAQRFNAAGVAQGGEFRINQFTTGDQMNPAIAMDSSGNFVVSWASNGQDGGGWGVYARRYTAAGAAQGNAFLVNGTTIGDQSEPAVAMSPTGTFVVTWTYNSDVYARLYNSSGVALGGEFIANNTAFKVQDQPDIAMDSSGNFVIVWNSNHQDQGGVWYGIFGQMFDAGGTPVGSEFQVNTFASGNQKYPSVAMDPTGDFVVTWTSDNRDGSGFGVFGQQYQSDRTKRGGEFRINTSTTNDQLYPSVAMDATGDYTVVWSSFGQDGSAEGIYGQMYQGGNDAPENSVPGSQTINEDTVLTFSGANAISIGDVDAGAGSIQVTLTATNGALTLSQVTGLTFTVGNGTANATMTFTGTIANINSALAGMTYTPTLNFNGSASIQIATNDLGNSGWGSPLSDTDSVSITVNAVNDAPVNSTPGAQTTNEDTALVFSSGNSNLISIGDIDAGSSIVRVTLTATNGTMALSQLTGLTFTTGTGTANSTMTFTGTIANINAALAGMSYAPTSNYNGAASVTIFTEDLANTGSGGNLTDTDTVNVTVNAVNDAPVNTVPGAQNVNEDSTLVFSSGNGNAVSISDVDAGSSSVKVTLSVTNGALTLSQITGLTFTTGDGTSDSLMVFTGTVANINAALQGMGFAPTANYNGSSTLQIVTDDQGNAGAGGPLTDTDTVSITVNAVNDAPVNSVPVAQSTNEDTTLVFSSGNGNQISISDIDAASGIVKVTLTATNGVLTLSQLAGLTFSVGDGTTDGTMTFTGTMANINAALNGLAFAPDLNYNGAASVAITTDDQGNVGIGGSLTDTDTVNITVNAVNDPPVNSVPVAQSTNEDTALVFSSGNGNLISISDLDAAAGMMQITLTATNGVLSLSQLTGLSFSVGDGTSDGTMTFTGTIADINAALNGLSFLGTLNYNGAASVSITTNDQGNTGIGGALSDTDSVNITVNAVNDPPVNNVPVAQSVNEDTTLVFSSGNGNQISISDLDAAAGIVQVTLTATNGALTLSQLTGLTFSTGDGTSDATMTFTGTIANINAALNGLSFLGTLNYNGAASVSITTNDQGNTGLGGALNDTDTVNITVNAVNDPPVNSVPAPQSTNEDTGLVFSSGNGNLISISDLDAATGIVQVTLTATNGVMSLSLLTGLTFIVGDGSADGTMTFTGTMVDINAALDGLLYMPDLNYNGPASVTITTDDQGNVGIGGALSDTDTVNITVNAVNDAPVNTVPAPQSTNEDTVLVFSSGNGNQISISDLDAAAGIVQVTLTATNGILTLSQLTGLTFVTGDGTADGTMTFTGTIANINAALNGLSFLPSPDYNGPASVSITTDDQGNVGIGGALTNMDTVNITVIAINDNPTVVVSGGTLAYTENDGPVVVDGSIVVDDIDSTNLASAVIQIVGYVAGEDVLSFTDQNGITGLWDSSTGTLTLAGSATVAEYQLALRSITYTNTSEAPSVAGRIVRFTVNDGALDSASTDKNISITERNDAPVISVPGGQQTDEDVALVFSNANGNAIAISDVDARSNVLQVTISVVHGVLTLGTTSGLSFSTGDGISDATMTFTGTLAQINAALDGLTYLGNANYNGADGVTVDVDDLGNMGIGGALTDSATVPVTVNAVNDVPVNSVPAAQSTNEDTPLVFSSGNGNLISVADLDVASGIMQVMLSATNGLITLGTVSGLTFITGDGVADGTMIFTGDIAAINAALDGLIFDPPADYNGPASITITTDDQGNTGQGGNLIDSDTINITVNAVNDAPIVTVPASQGTDEDTNLVFSSGNGNAITINDIDLLGGVIQVTLTSTNGVLTLSGLTGLTFSAGDGTADATMTFTGTLVDVNAALAGLVYSPNLNYNGAASITVAADDLGQTGIGGALSDSKLIFVDVNAVNDAPVNSVPGAQSTNEDTQLVFSSGNGNLISIADLDVASELLKVTLSVAHGSLTLADLTGLTFLVGDGAGDGTMTFTGTLANINAALNGLSYVPSLNYNGSDTLTITTNDQGNVGIGGNLIDTDTVAITVNAVNDAPIIVVPAAQNVNEDTTLVFSSGHGNLISIADLDVLSGMLQVTISVMNGKLTLSQITGLTFILGDGSNDVTMTFLGTLADVNAALDGMHYHPDADYFGADTVSIAVDDEGNTGIGGTLTDAKTVDITVDPVNDPPVITRGGSGITYTENDPKTAIDPGISLGDVDNITLSGAVIRILNDVAGEDLLSFIDQNGITGSWNAAMGTLTLSGVASVADYETALRSITYSNTSENPHTAPRAVRVTVNDGSADSAPVDYTVSIVSVNDKPTGRTVPDLEISEDSEPIGIALWKFFADAEDKDSDLVLNVTGNTNSALFSNVSIDPATGRLIMEYAPDANGETTLTIRATDRGGKFVEIQIKVIVDPVNDSPKIVSSEGTISYAVSDTTIEVDSGISVGDIDSATLASAAVRMLDYNPGEDVLHFVSRNGITANWDEKTGTLTLSGAASVADYENALRSITYENTAGHAHAGSRTLEFAVNDGRLASNVALRSIDVASVQQVQPPVFEAPPPPAAPPPAMEGPVPPAKTPEPKHEPAPPVPQPVSFPQPPAKRAEDPPAPAAPPPATVAQVEPKPEPKPEPIAVAQPAPKPPDVPAPLAVDPPAAQMAKPKHYETAQLWKQLDLLSQEINEEGKSGKFTVGTVSGLTTTLLSVGYVIWCLRGGTMVATLLTTLPLWRFMDPLPVLEIYEKDRKKKKDKEIADEDEERIRSMMD